MPPADDREDAPSDPREDEAAFGADGDYELPDDADLTAEDETPPPRRVADDDDSGEPIAVKRDWPHDAPTGENYSPLAGALTGGFEPVSVAPPDIVRPMNEGPRAGFETHRRVERRPGPLDMLAEMPAATLVRFACGISAGAIAVGVGLALVVSLFGGSGTLGFASVLTVCGFGGVALFTLTAVVLERLDGDEEGAASRGRQPPDAFDPE